MMSVQRFLAVRATHTTPPGPLWEPRSPEYGNDILVASLEIEKLMCNLVAIRVQQDSRHWTPQRPTGKVPDEMLDRFRIAFEPHSKKGWQTTPITGYTGEYVIFMEPCSQ